MGNVEQVKTGAVGERVSGGRRRSFQRALGDLVPITFAAGAAAVAVAVAVGGSTSSLPSPFAPGPRGSDRVTSTPATPQPLGGTMSVRVAPRATRTSAAPGLVQHLVAPWPGVTERPMVDRLDSVLFAPILLSEAADGAGALTPPAAGSGDLPEVVVPAPAVGPSDGIPTADVSVTAPSGEQEAQRVQRPRRLKSPKAAPEAEAGAQPLVAQAASLSPSTSPPDTSHETGASEGPRGDHGNGKGNASSPGKGNCQGNDKHKAAGGGQPRTPGSSS